jgi:glutamyl-tRNA reductase
MKNILLIGINHKTAPIEIREKLSFSQDEIIKANEELIRQLGLDEGLILSTCNRVEIYAVANRNRDDKDYIHKIKYFLSRFHDLNLSDFEDKLYIFQNEEAVKHLFKVASGLDSLVIGEAEILGQVKQAYNTAKESASIGKVLHRLLQRAFHTAKKIRTNTFIARGPVSVSSVAVRLAKKILGNLTDKKVLIIGAGSVGEQLVLYLKKNGIGSILVSNRTYEKAKVLAERFNAHALEFEKIKDVLAQVDIVITSTSATYHLISKEDILTLMPKRGQRPLFIIDLAVPRNVEEEINRIDNVYLYNIDDLKMIVDKNMELRKKELNECDKIIAASSKVFLEWLVSESDLK